MSQGATALVQLAQEKSVVQLAQNQLRQSVDVAQAFGTMTHNASRVVGATKGCVPHVSQIADANLADKKDSSDLAQAVSAVLTECDGYQRFVVDLVSEITIFTQQLKNLVTNYFHFHSKAERELKRARESDGWNFANIKPEVESLREEHTSVQTLVLERTEALRTRLTDVKGEQVVTLINLLNGASKIDKIALKYDEELQQKRNEREDILSRIECDEATKQLKDRQLKHLKQTTENKEKRLVTLQHSMDMLKDGSPMADKVAAMEACIEERCSVAADLEIMKQLREEQMQAQRKGAERTAQRKEDSPEGDSELPKDDDKELETEVDVDILHDLMEKNERRSQTRLAKAYERFLKAAQQDGADTGKSKGQVDEEIENLSKHLQLSLDECNKERETLSPKLMDLMKEVSELDSQIKKDKHSLGPIEKVIADLDRAANGAEDESGGGGMAVSEKQRRKEEARKRFEAFDLRATDEQLPKTSEHFDHVKVRYRSFLEEFVSVTKVLGRMIRQLELSEHSHITKESWPNKVLKRYVDLGVCGLEMTRTNYKRILRHIMTDEGGEKMLVEENDIDTFADTVGFEDFLVPACIDDWASFRKKCYENFVEELASRPDMGKTNAQMTRLKNKKKGVDEKLEAAREEETKAEKQLEQARSSGKDKDEIDEKKDKWEDKKGKVKDYEEALSELEESIREAKVERTEVVLAKFEGPIKMFARVLSDLHNALLHIVRIDGAEKIETALHDNKEIFGVQLQDFLNTLHKMTHEFTAETAPQ